MLYRCSGLFQGENGSHGMAMHSAVSATAAANSSAMRSLGSHEWCSDLHLRAATPATEDECKIAGQQQHAVGGRSDEWSSKPDISYLDRFLQ